MPETSLSKYVGESEKIISSILSAVNDSEAEGLSR
jgi:SpoVK/Ycf46/Vps4 family AAA+-type ATPase